MMTGADQESGTAWKQLHLLLCPRENVTWGGNDAENDLFVVFF